MAIGPFWIANITLAILSVALLGVIAVIYIRNWRRIRSSLLVGLLVFAALFLIANIAATYYYYMLAQTYAASVAVPLLVVHLLQFVGLSVFLYVTLR